MAGLDPHREAHVIRGKKSSFKGQIKLWYCLYFGAGGVFAEVFLAGGNLHVTVGFYLASLRT